MKSKSFYRRTKLVVGRCWISIWDGGSWYMVFERTITCLSLMHNTSWSPALAVTTRSLNWFTNFVSFEKRITWPREVPGTSVRDNASTFFSLKRNYRKSCKFKLRKQLKQNGKHQTTYSCDINKLPIKIVLPSIDKQKSLTPRDGVFE